MNGRRGVEGAPIGLYFPTFRQRVCDKVAPPTPIYVAAAAVAVSHPAQRPRVARVVQCWYASAGGGTVFWIAMCCCARITCSELSKNPCLVLYSSSVSKMHLSQIKASAEFVFTHSFRTRTSERSRPKDHLVHPPRGAKANAASEKTEAAAQVSTKKHGGRPRKPGATCSSGAV